MIQHLGWMGFKIMEIVLGMFCLVYHIKGFLYVEMSSEFYTYTSIFTFSAMLAMMSSVNICFARPPSLWCEIIVNCSCAVVYIITSLCTMYQAEKDFYLIYLDGLDDDTIFPFFYYSKAQSIAALATGVIYMLHTFLLFDAITYDVLIYLELTEYSVGKPLELYCFGKTFHNLINDYEGYQRISQVRRSQVYHF